MKKIFVVFVVLGILLTACGGENIPDENMPPLPDGGNSDGDSGGNVPDSPGSPETPIINLPGEVKFQDQEPEPGQAEWAEGKAFVNDVQLSVMESFPIQVGLQMQGELPTPCNKLTVDISEPDADNNIRLEVYSLVNPAETCIAVIEPFAVNISLPTGNLADGTYSVFVNDTLVGEFTYPGG